MFKGNISRENVCFVLEDSDLEGSNYASLEGKPQQEFNDRIRQRTINLFGLALSGLEDISRYKGDYASFISRRNLLKSNLEKFSASFVSSVLLGSLIGKDKELTGECLVHLNRRTSEIVKENRLSGTEKMILLKELDFFSEKPHLLKQGFDRI